MASKMKWYSSLKPKEGEEGWSLLAHENILQDTLIVCQHLSNGRSFTAFPNYIDFMTFFRKKVKSTHQCFYEEILENKIQKPYFDIDIEITLESSTSTLCIEDAITLRDEVCNSIMKEFPLIKETDIMIFNSNSEKKYSYHIIVDNWCVMDHEENRSFYEKVKKNISPKFLTHPFLDHAVYKCKQQLRTYGSHKWGSTRVKVLDPSSKWVPKIKPLSENHQFIVVLAASLVTNASYCKILSSLLPPRPKKLIYDGGDSQYALKREDVTQCIELFKTRGFFPFKVLETKGSMILLTRTVAHNCLICKRTHDNENAFLTVNGAQKNVYFHCYRAPEDEDGKKIKLHLGCLKDFTVEEFISMDISPESSHNEDVTILPSFIRDDEKLIPVPSSEVPVWVRPQIPLNLTSLHHLSASIASTTMVRKNPKLSKSDQLTSIKKHTPNFSIY
jgi:hypothetical protein